MSCERGVTTPVELRWGTQNFSRVATRESELPHVVRGNSGFHSSCCKGIRHYLQLRGNSLSFPHVARNTGFLLTCNGDLGIPFKWQHGSQNSTRAEVGKLCFILNCRGVLGPTSSYRTNSGFFSSCCWKLSVSSRVSTGDREFLSKCSEK